MNRILSLSLLFVLLLLGCSAAPAELENGDKPRAQCVNICTLEYAPVCGYDGTCYKVYGNKCAYDEEKCSRKSNLETVDSSLCELAEKDTHPNFKLC